MGMVKHSQVLKIASLQCLYNTSKKKLTFWRQINIRVSYILISTIGHQVFPQGDRHNHENVKGTVMGMIKHSQSTQSNMFAMPLQYL